MNLKKTMIAANSFDALCVVALVKKMLRSASLPRRLLLGDAPSSYFIVQIIAYCFSFNYSTCRHTDFLFFSFLNSACVLLLFCWKQLKSSVSLQGAAFSSDLLLLLFLPFLLTWQEETSVSLHARKMLKSILNRLKAREMRMGYLQLPGNRGKPALCKRLKKCRMHTNETNQSIVF